MEGLYAPKWSRVKEAKYIYAIKYSIYPQKHKVYYTDITCRPFFLSLDSPFLVPKFHKHVLYIYVRKRIYLSNIYLITYIHASAIYLFSCKNEAQNQQIYQ